jgi:glycosyltransferase involved in cell wall biosynthesis
MSRQLSIILPCYRLDGFLPLALTSVNSAAKGLDVECLIVANNLNPAQIARLTDIASGLFSIPFRIVNAGKTDLVGALNFGLTQTDSVLIARMDQDDVMIESRLRKQVQFLETNPDIALVGSNTVIINSDGDVIALQRFPLTSEDISSQLKIGNCFAHPSVMFRRQDVVDAGAYDARFTQAEDFALYVKLNDLGYKLANLDEPLLKYRIGEQQVSSISRDLQIATTRVIIILQWTKKIASGVLPVLPEKAEYFSDWLLEVEDYAKRCLRPNKSFYTEQRVVRKALAISFIAVARSSSTLAGRNWSDTVRYLYKSYRFSPFWTFFFIVELIRGRK